MERAGKDATGAGLGSRLLTLARRAPDLTALVVMAAAGIGISIYLTAEHYAKRPPICPATGLIDCAKVTASQYSVVPGTQIPITIPGMLWFLVAGGLAVLAFAALRRGEPEARRLRQGLLVWGALGLLTVLYLVFVEIVRLRSICLWCTAIHLLTFASFLVILNHLQQPSPAVAQSLARSARPAPPPPARATSMARTTTTRTASPARRAPQKPRGRR